MISEVNPPSQTELAISSNRDLLIYIWTDLMRSEANPRGGLATRAKNGMLDMTAEVFYTGLLSSLEGKARGFARQVNFGTSASELASKYARAAVSAYLVHPSRECGVLNAVKLASTEVLSQELARRKLTSPTLSHITTSLPSTPDEARPIDHDFVTSVVLQFETCPLGRIAFVETFGKLKFTYNYHFDEELVVVRCSLNDVGAFLNMYSHLVNGCRSLVEPIHFSNFEFTSLDAVVFRSGSALSQE